MELSERKRRILGAIIESYIETAEPVGSRTIAKLSDMNISSATIRNEMADLEEMGYLDDERYAQNLAEELFERKGMGLRRIEQELCSRGVSRETARQCVENIECDNVSRIVDLLQTKFAGRFDDEKGKKRTFAALTRLGYTYSDIMSAMRRVGEDYFEDDYS